MKINVPLLSTHDILIIGGTVKAVKMALDLREAGHTVFIATPFSAFGEDLCATLDLQSRKPSAYKAIFGDTRMRTPAEIKRALDQAVIDAGIDFLFQLRPVRPAFSDDGAICGALFADRGGFHAIAAKVIIDATDRQTFARAARLPTRPFKPGRHIFRMFAIGGVNTDSSKLNIRQLAKPIRTEGHCYPVFEVSQEVRLTGNSVFDIARAVAAFRHEAWDGAGTACSDAVIMDLQDGVVDTYTPSEKCPVIPADRCTARQAGALAAALPTPRPSGFNENPLNHPFEVVRKDHPFRFRDCPTIPFDLNAIPVISDCDVFVAGGGTGGAPAAISAARAGMRTVCAENLPTLGGVMLAGRIGSYYHGNRVGFTREVDTGIRDMAPNPDFDIEKGQMNVVWKNQWFMDRATEKGAHMLSDTLTVAAAMDGHTACGAVVLSPFGIGIITASFVIDATGNADFVAASGAPTVNDMREEAAVQGAGLSPVRLGENYTNTDFTFVLDSDIVDTTRAFVTARAKYLDTFDIASILNTRERRRIVGDIVLQPMDFFANRIYKDTLTVAKSNFDTHGFIIHPMFMIQPTAHEDRFADVPLRALLPQGYDGMAATGLSVSAHRDCMPLIRMQPDVQNQGYAMGLAAAMAVKGRCPIREIDVRALQKKLVSAAILPERVLTDTDTPCVPVEDDPYRDISRFFMEPGTAVAELRKRRSDHPDDVRTAAILAFLGDDSGRHLLIESIRDTDWDEGWNYRGMGQFGPSMSPLDAWVIALAQIGGDERIILEKLRTLTIESAFSHIRAVALALIRNPVLSAADELERILDAPGATGHAILSFQDAIASNRPDTNDNTFRNAQLKEVYLAKALWACNPGSQMARTILDGYVKGMQGLFSIFAGT